MATEEFDVGSNINGYGGGAFTVDADGCIVFIDANTKAVYRARPGDGEAIDTITMHPDTVYGDLAAHPTESRHLLAVRELKSPGKKHPDTSIVCIDTEAKSVRPLREDSDFFSHPRFSLDGTKVCWLQWDHPHMPWTGARLYTASWTGAGLSNVRRVGSQGGCGQPRWGVNETLFYAHDETGYQQLYRVRLGEEPQWLRIAGLERCELAGAEFLLSSNTYLELEEGHLVVSYTREGCSRLALVNCAQAVYVDLDMALNDIAYDAMQRISHRSFLVIGAGVDCAAALYRVQLPDDLDFGHPSRHPCQVTMLAQSFDISFLPEGSLSRPVPVTFPRSSGPIKSGHAFLMLPTNSNHSDHALSAAELPPCIIAAHGGPTKHHRPSINLEYQYFTSRGYAVVLLNHVGSTGYGNAYRDAMDGRWGEADVQDAVDCVEALAGARLIDPRRVGIAGPSAGGYLTLQAACTRPGVWAGAVSVFGISDVAGFARTTHKFESCYDYLLVRGRLSLSGSDRLEGHGSSTLTERMAENDELGKGTLAGLYDERSPIKRAHRLEAPVLLLQGSVDSVVTPDQATDFVAAAKRGRSTAAGPKAGDLVELVVYGEEGHGFHLARTRQDALIRQESWWQKTLLGL